MKKKRESLKENEEKVGHILFLNTAAHMSVLSSECNMLQFLKVFPGTQVLMDIYGFELPNTRRFVDQVRRVFLSACFLLSVVHFASILLPLFLSIFIANSHRCSSPKRATLSCCLTCCAATPGAGQ